jgi:hypothetical protein
MPSLPNSRCSRRTARLKYQCAPLAAERHDVRPTSRSTADVPDRKASAFQLNFHPWQAGVQIRDSQWIAIDPIPRPELPLEVRGPQIIQLRGRRRHHAYRERTVFTCRSMAGFGCPPRFFGRDPRRL